MSLGQHLTSLPPPPPGTGVSHGHQPLISRTISKSSLATSDCLSLFVRHFPSWLNIEEKESLLRHFGAREVAVMGTKGKTRNCAFVKFENPDEARWALNKLHQLDVFGHRLTVEYAKPAQTRLIQQPDMDKWACNRSKVSDIIKKEKDGGTAQSLQETIKDPSPQRTPPVVESPCYLYPPPTSTTLTNITNALACVPKLYVQVLHLMNRMNLPPPFGELIPTPPLPSQETQPTEDGERTYSSPSEDEGSEIASDEDGLTKKVKHAHLPKHAPKRRAVSYKQMKNLLPSLKKRRTEETEAPTHQPKKIELHIPSEIAAGPEIEVYKVTYMSEDIHKRHQKDTRVGAIPLMTHSESSLVRKERVGSVGGASTIAEGSGEVDMERGKRENEEFISIEELSAHRITEREMHDYSVFNKYSPGEPSMRLYIKNLSKLVEEKDLRYIYGSYVNWSSEKECNAFDIRVMQTGRMKGQAFVGLPSEEVAVKALRETNGYMLQDKPMVVQFGRSTKAKDTTNN